MEVHPGRNASVQKEPARVHISGGKVAKIELINTSADSSQYALEPELVTNFVGAGRSSADIFRDTYERRCHHEAFTTIYQNQ